MRKRNKTHPPVLPIRSMHQLATSNPANRRDQPVGVAPADAKRIIGSRRMSSKIYRRPYASAASVTGFAAAPGRALNTTQSPASIAELARALRNDPDLIFAHVYNNIEFHPTYGVQKGSLGCLIDGIGNAWDQASLLVDLLREAGFTANFVFGEIELSQDEVAAWLGTDSSNIYNAYYTLSQGGVPCEVFFDFPNWTIQISHIWVQVTIDATDYVFDPAFKSYSNVAGIDLATAMDYDQVEFLTDASAGATLDDDYTQDLNQTNINSNLATYATNLITHIRENTPTATLAEVIGGRKIIQNFEPVRQTSLPYEIGEPDVWENIGSEYKTTLRIQYIDIDETFYSEDLHASRLTLFFNNSNEPELRLDGALVATGMAQTSGTFNSALITVEHPYPVTWYDQTFYQGIYAPFTGGGENHYLLGTTFGPSARGMVDYHNQRFIENTAAGGDILSEPILGEKLSRLWNTYAAEGFAVNDMLGRMSNCIQLAHHLVGMVMLQNATGQVETILFDVNGAVSVQRSLGEGDSVAFNTAVGMHGYTLEQLAIQQVCGTSPAGSTNRILEVANADGLKIFKGTDANWTADVRPNLTGYNSGDLDGIKNFYLDYDWFVLIPEETGQEFGAYVGNGWQLTSSVGGAIGIINSSYLGSTGENGDKTPDEKKTPEENKKDPVGFLTGRFKHRQTDLTVGSGEFPYKLSLENSYDSGDRFRSDRPMGLGWSHNWLWTAKETSDAFQGLGSESPIDAAASIVEMFITLDLLVDTDYPVLNMVTIALCNSWWCEAMTENVVVVEGSNLVLSFAKLPDDSYNAPYRYGEAWVLEKNTTFSLTTPHKDVRNFDVDGNLDTWAFPYGVTISLTYNSGKLSTVDNGMGRTLNFSYTGNKLTSVDDDNSRTVEFTYDGEELIAITDPLDEDVTFEYDEPGRMVSYFLPENPVDPMIVNTYDSLDRIASQLDMYDNELFWYFAGWRSELVDVDGSSLISQFDEYGNNVKSIDQLGFETNYDFDGRGRLIGKVMPEGNSISWTLDQNNNILTETRTAKPGSSLNPIVRTLTWDATYNKVATEEDGNDNVTSYFYDPTTGQLIDVERAEVGGQVPTVSYRYNGRGQVLSKIDETGIQTQYSYDGLKEELLSVIVNTNWNATIGGAVTVSDQLNITVHDSGLGGGQKTKSYTVVTDDTLADIAAGLAGAINSDSEITDLGITAKVFETVISLSTSPGNTTTFTQTTSGGASETITLAAGLDLTTEYGYNSWGDIDSTQDARGNIEGRTLDAKRRLTQIVSPSPFSFITNRTYDKNDNLRTIERETGDLTNPWQIAEATYNLSNQVESLTVAGALYTNRLYNKLQKIWKETDGNGRTSEFLYDERQRLVTVIDSSLAVSEIRTYTGNGLLSTVEDANQNVTEYLYDGFDRLDSTIFPDASVERNLLHDFNGNVLTRITRNGDIVEFVYDSLNRLIEKSPEGMPSVMYEYDLVGRRTKASTVSVLDNPSSGNWIFSFDSAGRLVEEVAPDGKAVMFDLDENGNVLKLTYPDSWYVERSYDEMNRLANIRLNGDVNPVAEFEYDFLSRRVLLEFNNDTKVEYVFELNDDLSSISMDFDGSAVEFEYSYNGAHQMISQTVSDARYLWHPISDKSLEYASNSLNQYIYATGSCGRLFKGYNANGCLVDDGVMRFDYDVENHLVSADDGSFHSEYVYDPMHRQIQKNVDGIKTRFVYSGWQRLADYDGTSDALQTRFVYGEGLDEPLVVVESGGVLTYLYADQLGSVVACANDAGVNSNHYAYSPHGESDDMGGTTIGFTSQRYDSETALYYFKHRYYSPQLGRFLQPDPIGFDGGDLNIYTYVNNDPLNLQDPLGLMHPNTQANTGWRPWGNPLHTGGQQYYISDQGQIRYLKEEWTDKFGQVHTLFIPYMGDPNHPLEGVRDSEPFVPDQTPQDGTTDGQMPPSDPSVLT